MIFNPFSIVLLCVLTFLFLFYGINKKTYCILFSLCCFSEINVSMGDFCSLNTFSISYSTFFSFSLVLLSFFVVSKEKPNFRTSIYPMLFVTVSFILSIVLMVCLPFTGKVIMGSWGDYAVNLIKKETYNWSINGISWGGIFNLITSPYIFFVFINYTSSKNKRLCIHTFVCLSLIASLFGIAEFFEENLFLENNIVKMVCSFFGYSGDAVHNYLYKKMGVYVSNGLTTEASFHAFSCIYSLIIISLERKKYFNRWNMRKRRRNFFMLLITFLSGLTTGSFTFFSLIFFFALWVVFSLKKMDSIKNRSISVPLAFLFLAFFLILLLIPSGDYSQLINSNNYLFQRIGSFMNSLSNMILNNAYFHTDSNNIRLLSIHDTFYDVFLKRPLFGIGIPQTFCHSSVLNDLISVGFIGTILWLVFIWSVLSPKNKNFFFLNLLFFVFIFPFFISFGSSIKELHIPLLLYFANEVANCSHKKSSLFLKNKKSCKIIRWSLTK